MPLPVVDNWFEDVELDQSIRRLSEPHVHSFIRGNIYFVPGIKRDLVIDSGTGVAALRPHLPLSRTEPLAVATHGHYDHVGGLAEFSDRRIHEAEAAALGVRDPMAAVVSRLLTSEVKQLLGPTVPEYLLTAVPAPDFDPAAYQPGRLAPTASLRDGDIFDLGDRRLEVLHLPGHSPGSICLLDPDARILFTGDVLYDEGLIDDVLPGTDRSKYIETMTRLADLDVATVYPGHGDPLTGDQSRQIIDDYLRSRRPAT